MAIDTTATPYDLRLRLPFKVKSGTHLLSTSNESLCQETPITIDEPVSTLSVSMPERSLNTYIFMIDRGGTDISSPAQSEDDDANAYYDLQGRRISEPRGLHIEKRPDGSAKKILGGK